ncbi:DUF1778 domain-containing protein [Testudinibacter sp. TR-2022]|uniref:type II toxin-antitoxin system TacA family antitoxin n=1 Tax=Testudinibacter sp. TR-2022 TaxID=2585029 RepID=UPI001119C882|nr:DUF1778 domain-containing protein [Testudinibacter sp. TR-2022]TNH04236.1 DUF1778 domain-containing protein [Pasteurellaceae bacterium Phil31]TNH05851.1 DUF1778 domain-containing protein [Pasteurellaceae bacterium Phil11]TNH09421.1 DUF1778 domain-containing protein [Testudinibacter sp. TR-2022]TNH11089.1 DUF1778 domain-containing protein [Testudinibacter sp. TR-2022]TNH11443.1 DUF1778 domain-containing protein [Testudinibacter sp. TR-2022]
MRSAPINLRAMPNQRELIDQAAALLGKTRSDFMLEVSCAYAKNVILDQTLFQLDDERFNRFVQLLDEPIASNPQLEKLLNRRTPWE